MFSDVSQICKEKGEYKMKEILKKLTRAVIACMLVLAVFSEASVAGAAQKVIKTNVIGGEGWLDPKGEIAVSDGLALVSTDGIKWFYIDTNGKKVDKWEYSSAYDLSDGMTWASKDGVQYLLSVK